MTSCYIYAIQPTGIDLPSDLRGFHKLPLDTVQIDDLAAIVAPHDAETPSPTPERVQAHHEVVTALRRVGPAIPVRFGTMFETAEAVRDVLLDKRDMLNADIERLAGTVEYGITTLWGDALEGLSSREQPNHEPATSGADYMRRRLAEVQWEDQLGEIAGALRTQMESRLEGLAMDSTYLVLPSLKIPVRSRYLVEITKSDEFKAACAELRRVCPAFTFSFIGPWPPYSFVTDPGENSPGT